MGFRGLIWIYHTIIWYTCIPVYICVAVCGVIVYFSYYKWVHDNSGMALSSHWPPYPCAMFFYPPPPSDSVFIRQSCIFHALPPYPSLEWSARQLQSPPAILHPHFLPICNHMIFWWGGQGKRDGAGGGGGVKGWGGSRNRGNVKYGREGKRKFARAVPRREDGDKGREGRGLPPCPPLIFENIRDNSYGFK